VELFIQETRKLNKRHRLGFGPYLLHFCVKFIAVFASLCEQPCGFRIERRSFRAIVGPIEKVGGAKQLLRIVRILRSIQGINVPQIGVRVVQFRRGAVRDMDQDCE